MQSIVFMDSFTSFKQPNYKPYSMNLVPLNSSGTSPTAARFFHQRWYAPSIANPTLNFQLFIQLT
jgi:hypothetical protein